MMYIRLCLQQPNHDLAKLFFKTARQIYKDSIIVDKEGTAMRYHMLKNIHCYDILLGKHSTPKMSHDLSQKLDELFPDDLYFEVEVTQEDADGSK